MERPSIDTWSVVITLNVARLAGTLAIAWCTPLQRTYPGFRYWVAGLVSGVIANACFALYPFLPGVSVPLTNLFNTLFVVLLLDGTVRFTTGQPLDRRWYALPVLGMAVASYFHFAADSPLARIWWVTLFLGTLATFAGLVWLRNPRPEARRLHHGAAALSFGYPVLMVGRALLLTFGPAVHSFFEPRPLDALFLLGLGVLDLVLIPLYLTLNSERVDADLQESRAEVELLSGILPMCSHCRRIREGHAWADLEDYVRRHNRTEFSHGFCPDCFQQLYPEDLDLLETNSGGAP